ncbi:class C beta-lactamase [Microbulbifer hydrolyticus]|uniref:Beta-lactamase n=2 Tax=Microbulbifer hydrolyticus TaxID=48074 RepID=A0AA89PBU0_9GAMM|nr:class C beta-lactamase [Microbulbifer hydrolyticus]MBB5211303.1 beta-lactamase class C [Microbulbifer hydrolyticus]
MPPSITVFNLHQKVPLLIVLVFGAYMSITAPAIANAESITPERLEEAVIDAVQPLVEKHRVPGMALALTIEGEPYFFNLGETALEGGEPITEHTLFEIGSVSKTFTATLAAYAEVKGALDFNEPVSGYLPALRGTAMDSVAVLNLATHTAGHFPLQVPAEVRSEDALLEYLRNWDPQYAPGSKRTYANPGSGLLGVVAARSLNQPFAKAMHESVFRGLGLSQTFVKVPEDQMAHYAEGHNSKHQPVRVNIGLLGEEAYGVRSSAADLTRYLAAQMELVKVAPALQQALQTTRQGFFRTDYYVQDMVWEQYALPLKKDTLLAGNSRNMISGDRPVTAISPPLPPQRNVLINKTGSTGGFSTYVAFIPEKQFAFVLLANKYFPNDERVAMLYGILEDILPGVVAK